MPTSGSGVNKTGASAGSGRAAVVGKSKNRLTIADIAREVGVSPSAVSFALNGRPGVSEATRTRILQAAERMNWHPHSAARALGGAPAGAVGLVLARPTRTLGAESTKDGARIEER